MPFRGEMVRMAGQEMNKEKDEGEGNTKVKWRGFLKWI
jgi:hypothetical protein